MYRCNDCGWVFEDHGDDVDSDTGESFECCPSCGSDDIIEEVE